MSTIQHHPGLMTLACAGCNATGCIRDPYDGGPWPDRETVERALHGVGWTISTDGLRCPGCTGRTTGALVRSLGVESHRGKKADTWTYSGIAYVVHADGSDGRRWCPHRHRSRQAALDCIARLTRGLAHQQVCHVCHRHIEATRSEACRQRWEPYSFSSQHTIDHGPMVCPECVTKAIDEVIAAIKLSSTSTPDACQPANGTGRTSQ